MTKPKEVTIDGVRYIAEKAPKSTSKTTTGGPTKKSVGPQRKAPSGATRKSTRTQAKGAKAK